MALKFIFLLPIFAPPYNPTASPHRPPTEIRFSRWNNANADQFNLRKRAQQEIEDDLRHHRRFDSAEKIATIYENATSRTSIETFKSTGTPSSPSRPSIPGKKSKYSKDPDFNPKNRHTSIRKKNERARQPNQNRNILEQRGKTTVGVSEDGVSFKVEGAPFEMMYSYTETPKVKPIGLREPVFSPFGPATMQRPWTGRAPLPGSKKRLKEFDSFVLPPPHKKGVKPVQKPGPFLPGSGPKYVESREEILGDPLTVEEVKELVQSSLKSDRQLNIGRDGLTHNMLDNIHAHWKRRRICKIKCKGVCTVDMPNVREQLEDKTGGKIIYSKGGALFLFRGRNYNYKCRPRYPIMLWKPVTPVYPRLIKHAPDGLTLEEAGIMRKKGRNLIPICKLAKNGMYSELVNNVREAFEACELVRINCEGLNPSDYRKIGAKLKDLVPCVLVSFEHQHILMWRGRNWKSSFLEEENNGKESLESSTDAASVVPSLEGREVSKACVPGISDNLIISETLDTRTPPMSSEDLVEEQNNDLSFQAFDGKITSDMVPNMMKITGNDSEAVSITNESDTVEGRSASTKPTLIDLVTDNVPDAVAEALQDSSEPRDTTTCTEGVLLLFKQALEQGTAIILEDAPLDDDIVYKRVVSFSQTAPPCPVFRYRPKRVMVQRWKKEQTGDSELKESITVSGKRAQIQKYEKKETGDVLVKEFKTVREKSTGEKNKSRSKKMNEFKVDYTNVAPPRGSLGVDELAKLLS